MRTWHLEMLVAAVVLGTVAVASGGGTLELLGATAVLLTFGHAQVADRLAEREAKSARPSVACHRWAMRYLVGKELLWLIYFVAHGAWSALAGVAIFLAYPVWRRTWRRMRPRYVPVAGEVRGVVLHFPGSVSNAMATQIEDRERSRPTSV